MVFRSSMLQLFGPYGDLTGFTVGTRPTGSVICSGEFNAYSYLLTSPIARPNGSREVKRPKGRIHISCMHEQKTVALGHHARLTDELKRIRNRLDR